jgi:hypothetical protein
LRALAIGAWLLCFGAARTVAAAPSLWTVDGQGTAARAADSRASLARTPPSTVPADPSRPHGDPAALRFLVAGTQAELPSAVTISVAGAASLPDLALSTVPCPKGVPASSCAVTEPIRLVADVADARHPLVAHRSLIASLGDSVEVTATEPLGRVLVSGPRDSPIGPIERHRATLRVTMVRLAPGGAVPVGGDDAGAKAVAHAALARINGLWGACGIDFGPPNELEVAIVSPPPPHLLAVGCGHALPATGGRAHFRVDGRDLAVTFDAGMSPAEAARRTARAIERAGFDVRLSDNPRSAASAGAPSDLSVRRADGTLATITRRGRMPLSDDATLNLCIGAVELEDGLRHFDDVNSWLGTLEERTLAKAFDDHDPNTIDVLLVPGLGRGGRTGESFIAADGGALRNVVVVDRAAMRSHRSSNTLSHEIGHVLLDDPGHPDDYGRDTPTRLMDSDAADPSAFGPRRLSANECARAIRQSGPRTPTPLLRPLR